MKHSDDTISAIATPLGVGGVGIIRISGSSARDVLSALTPLDNGQIVSHKMEHGWIMDPKSSNKIDEAMYCFMAGPKSYTGEDVAEFYCHGSNAILQQVLSLTLMHGARLAQRGEFTKRAFLNGKLDLTQAEAVLDMVSAPTIKGSGLALAQLEGRLSEEVGRIRE